MLDADFEIVSTTWDKDEGHTIEMKVGQGQENKIVKCKKIILGSEYRKMKCLFIN